jgi:uncharacterized membrane protein YkvA (DUF1232 family)
MEEPRTDQNGPISEPDLARRIQEEPQVSRERADRFYDRVRTSIRDYVDRKGKVLGKTAEYLMLVPDVFILLWRLTNDRRVSGKDKVLLGSALAYFILPFDLMPEALVGPIGYMDDLVFAVYVLNKMITSTDPAILREHWSGSEDVLAMMQRVLNAADSLVGGDIVGKLKKLIKR